MRKYRVNHRQSPPYHPQSNDQEYFGENGEAFEEGLVQEARRGLVGLSYRSKNPDRHVTIQIGFRQNVPSSCGYQTVKEVNMQPHACAEERKLQLQELEELRLESYDAAMWYKEKTKLWHDKNLRLKELKVGHRVLLFLSRLKLMSGKLKSKWTGPYTIIALRANGAVELQGSDPNSAPFLVNGHRVKPFRDNSEVRTVEEIQLRIPGVLT
ncbi:uncharacterized protein LOC121796807 [Salvia splendens]|uniref:uncharacterized protein LOC121796807 n=1 Tax=Salvia splendens TaxID=180675 RepID=UPI001C2764DD|nr:uncharacterized protein LOC121796807 [Salvia splendens]